MAPTRPFWKGYLKLSLVSCPIALYPGTSSTDRVSFRQINKKTGNRLRQQLVDEVTREVVEGDNKGRGYEYAKNAYIAVDNDELDAIAVESYPARHDQAPPYLCPAWPRGSPQRLPGRRHRPA
jgi:DNA end-binding protein Ku